MPKKIFIPLFLFITFLLGGCDYFSKKPSPPSSPPAAAPSPPVKVEAPTPPPTPLMPSAPPAPSPTSILAIEGTYSVAGSNPGGRGTYRGTATIAKEGESYRVNWRVGTVYDGIGTLQGNVFKVEWGDRATHLGTVTYTVEPSGMMRGTWFVDKNPNLLGTETLTPR